MSTESLKSTQNNPADTVATRRRSPPAPGHIVRRIAASLKSDTKTDARAGLRQAGYAGSEKYVDQVLAARDQIQSRRSSRRLEDARRRLGHTPVRPRSAQGRAPVVLPRGTPSQRLTAVRKAAVREAAYELLRHRAAGGHSFRVDFALDASHVGYCVTMASNRQTYAGRFKGWLAAEDHHHVCVPADWRVRVLGRGLAHLGGMLTLDAHRLQAPDDVQLYAATWARQGRGYDVVVERGYVGIVGDEHFHAETPERAVEGARRKARAAGRERKAPFQPLSVTVDEFIKRYRKVPTTVRVSDAEETGSCDYGIRSWCAAVGLDYAAGEAPLSEVLDGFKLRPQVEVRRAVLFAVRRYSAEKRTERRRSAESSSTPAFQNV
jgi:hypothetical protein